MLAVSKLWISLYSITDNLLSEQQDMFRQDLLERIVSYFFLSNLRDDANSALRLECSRGSASRLRARVKAVGLD